MSEKQKKYTIESEVSEDHEDALGKDIKKLYTVLSEHEDFGVYANFNESLAMFTEVLLETFTDEELRQLPSFHALIKSGIPSGGIVVPKGVVLITPEQKEEIETAIQVFIDEQTDLLEPND